MAKLDLQKLVMAMDEEYPILEYLILVDPLEDKSTGDNHNLDPSRDTSSTTSTSPGD
jgi:hypothetical protein